MIALITGASSGIGEVFARKLAARGYDLIVVARREDRLRALAASLGTRVDVCVADLARDEGIATVERAIRECGDLALLVNNAGFGTLGRFWQIDVAGQERIASCTRPRHHAAHARGTGRDGGARPGR